MSRHYDGLDEVRETGQNFSGKNILKNSPLIVVMSVRIICNIHNE